MADYREEFKELSREVVVRALFENYESIYTVDIETSEFHCFHESDSYSSLSIESSGEDFFRALETNILTTIYPEDRDYVLRMISAKALAEGLEKNRFYSIVYRLVIDEKPLYHKLRATKEVIGGRPHYLIGIRNIDATFRQDMEQTMELSTMQTKENNHLEAILASAQEYLEVNLTKNVILELSQYASFVSAAENLDIPIPKGELPYSTYMEKHIERYLVENKKKFSQISDRSYLIRCYLHGEKRASASYSVVRMDGTVKYCKIVFYLYQDASSEDVLAFCVIYDLTEQQRQEKELQDLEKELNLSRIRNFTSQMQPHFLYNALGSIQEVVLDDPVYAADLIGDFTTHLRSCIRAMANDTPIPFEEELENIKAYVNIEKMRFGTKLKVIYDIKTCDFSVPALSIQPLVENAIRHGIYQRGEQGGTVKIQTERKNNNVCITISDNGVGFNVSAFQAELASGKRDSTGLKNIRFRLAHIMNASVDILSRVGKGTIVQVNIPKENEN